jgi:hypothetical protein
MLFGFIIVVLLGGAFLIKLTFDKHAYNNKLDSSDLVINSFKENSTYPKKVSGNESENSKPEKANITTIETISEDMMKDQRQLDELFESDRNRGPGYWQNIDVTQIEDSNDFREFLRGFHLTIPGITLSKEQRHELVNAMENMCFAFNNGEFSDFASFRLPAEYKIKPEATKWYKDRLIDQMGLVEDDIPQDPLKIWMLYWEEKNKTSQSFKNFWRAVSTPRVTITTHRALPISLMEREALLGHRTYAPAVSVNFKRSATGVLKDEHKLLCGDIEILVNHITGLTYPVTVRSYWDSKVEKWIPMEMILAYTGKGRLIDPDF